MHNRISHFIRGYAKKKCILWLQLHGYAVALFIGNLSPTQRANRNTFAGYRMSSSQSPCTPNRYISDHRLSTSCAVVERPDHRCGDDLVHAIAAFQFCRKLNDSPGSAMASLNFSQNSSLSVTRWSSLGHSMYVNFFTIQLSP